MANQLSFPQNYNSIFFELKQKEEQKNIYVNNTNKYNYNKLFSKEELIQAIKATKNCAPGPD